VRFIFKSIVVLFTVLSSSGIHAQNILHDSFGKGISAVAKDSSYYLKFSARFQSLYEGYYTIAKEKYQDNLRLRRARLKLDGFVLSPKVIYKIEYDMVNAFVLDAVVKWNFIGNFTLWFGQTKLPGNRERLISSQKMQMVDRSLLNSKFTLDRDQGIQLRHHFKLGNMVIREAFSVSVGEGKNYTSLSDKSGYDYTEKIEILPFGPFTKKGDYSGGDLVREEKLKLSLAFTYDYNDNAIKERGQKGDELSEQRDITTFFADMMMKYKGLSLMAEYVNRTTTKTPLIFDSTGAASEWFYTGTAFNLQLGYVLKSNWEISGRYTEVTPEEITGNNNINMYTMGISKYIVGHNLKVQGDFSFLEEEYTYDQVLFRLQLELAL